MTAGKRRSGLICTKYW